MPNDNFIGGRVPQEVKRELKARAITAGKTMQELLEEIIFDFLEGREEVKSIDTSQLLDVIKEAISELELPEVGPSASREEISEMISTRVGEASEKLNDRLEQLQENVENIILSRLEGRIESMKEDLEDAISDIENNMVYADDGEEQVEDFTGFRKLMAEEVNCVIVSVYENYLEEDDFDRVEMLRRISQRFMLEAEEQRSPECRDNFRQVLPQDFAEEVAKVVTLAVADIEFEDEKSDVFGKLYELFEQAAKLALKEQNTVKVIFDDPEQLVAIDRLIDSLAENKEAVRDRRSLIKYLIGEALIQEGEKSFWSDDELLVNAGKKMLDAALK